MRSPPTSVPGRAEDFPSVPASSPRFPQAYPFDAAASAYDADFTGTQLARWLRVAVWDVLGDLFAPGDRVLELGCGTGEDAVWLAQRGVHVTATDASLSMLDIARRKAETSGVANRADFLQLDLAAASSDRLPITDHHLPFTGAFSNFGPLNCLPDRRPLAGALARWIKPGGALVLVVMGPTCPWRSAGICCMANRAQHFAASAAVSRPMSAMAATIPIWYPSPRTLAHEFSHDFEVIELRGVGSVLPPSVPQSSGRAGAGFVQQAGKAGSTHSAATSPATWLNDHYL